MFEPYPMRDTVQHFCEKHLDKIKSYMEKVSVRIPPPAKCTIEGNFLQKFTSLQFVNIPQADITHKIMHLLFFFVCYVRTNNLMVCLCVEPNIWIL